MKTILFQGDSITDCGRDRKDPLGLGQGYPFSSHPDLDLNIRKNTPF